MKQSVPGVLLQRRLRMSRQKRLPADGIFLGELNFVNYQKLVIANPALRGVAILLLWGFSQMRFKDF